MPLKPFVPSVVKYIPYDNVDSASDEDKAPWEYECEYRSISSRTEYNREIGLLVEREMGKAQRQAECDQHQSEDSSHTFFSDSEPEELRVLADAMSEQCLEVSEST
jgi:hypothetical protein